MSILSVNHVCYTYSPNTPFVTTAVKDVSFSVNKGEIFGIIGHTGSGKSTLLQLLNGLLKPTSGQILLNGTDIWEKPKEIRKIRSHIGLVFQYPEYQLFEETVLADISFGPKNMGLNEEQAKEAALRAAETMGVQEELLNQSPFDLSGGEKRRVAIAGVMAMEPEIIVFDEPTAGLDPIGRETVLSALMQYRADHNATVILVSHSMEDMALICDHIMVMNSGENVMLDTVPGIFRQAERLSEIGLAVPYVTSVLLGLKKKGLPVSTDCFTVDEAVHELLRLAGKEADHA